MDIAVIANYINDNKLAREFLQNRNILKRNRPLCELCHLEMTEIKFDNIDNLIHRCVV